MKTTFKALYIPKKILIILLLLLAVLLFFRLYNIIGYLGFGHDEDLGSFIAKELVVDKNLRLIGQETSMAGFFIGPLFYYLQAFYFAIFGMDPIGGLYLTLTISILTFFSVFYIFRYFFKERVALISSFIYVSSAALAGHDTWIVPTQPTLFWTVWYLFALFYIIDKGSPKIFLLLGLLLGLIWHIHIAFAPLLLLIPLAFFLSKNKPRLKNLILNKYILLGATLFIILMFPFFIFEIRHDFLQTNSLINSLHEDRGQSEGRLFKVYDGASWSFMNIIYEVKYISGSQIRILQFILLGLFITMLIFNYKSLGKKVWIIYGWIALVIISQLSSKRAISEYYFTNLTILEILTIALFLNSLFRQRLLKLLVIPAMAIFLLVNLKSILAHPPNGEGYLARKGLISFIAIDARSHNYPCISINYMTSPGKDAGFRYFFWWNNLKVIQPGNGVAVYSILNPAAMSESEIAKREWVLGVILPDNPKVDPAVCDDPDRRLLPMFLLGD